MMKKLSLAAVAFSVPFLLSSLLAQDAPGGLEEQVLVVPDYGKETILLDAQGQVKRLWKSEHTNGGGARLLKDGALLHVVRRPLERPFQKSITGGGLEILDASSKVVWSFWNSTSNHATCGDAIQLANGHVLTTIVEWKSKEEALQAGRDPKFVDENGMLVPAIMEVKPNGPTGGIPLWKWSLWDHIYQQRDPSLDHYAHPEPKEGCVDINAFQRKSRRWIAPFEMDYHEGKKLILLTFRDARQAWVIDHSTSAAEAATDKGGQAGRGGRLLQVFKASKTPEQTIPSVISSWWQEGAGIGLFQVGSTIATLNQDGEGTFKYGHLGTPITKPYIRDGQVGAGPRLMAANARPGKDGSMVFTSGFTGQIIKLSPSGEVVWSYQNTHGKTTFKTSAKEGEEGCCGGGAEPPPATTTNSTSQPAKAPEIRKVEVAPVNRLYLYHPSSAVGA